MKLQKAIFMPIMICVFLISCSHKVTDPSLSPGYSSVTGSSLNAYTTVKPEIESYNSLTMKLDDEPITYTIDISTPEGKSKLNNLTLNEAKELALVEAVMYAKCATMFNPQYTHLVQNGKVLRITIYGYPARYKNM